MEADPNAKSGRSGFKRRSTRPWTSPSRRKSNPPIHSFRESDGGAGGVDFARDPSRMATGAA